MPSIAINKQRFQDALTKDIDDETTMSILSQLGVEVEAITDEAIELEIFPNRPDLLSLPGIVRNTKGLLDEATGQPTYEVQQSSNAVIVDDSVLPVRPETACAIVKDLTLTEDLVDELVTLQEKIHVTYGRDRRKCALGLYPLSKITFPVTYQAKNPDDITFTPLGGESPQTAKTILKSHEKGQEYEDLLKNHDQYPVFTDATDATLSLPPIINSEHTGRVTTSTEDLFIEASGHDRQTVIRALNIVCAHLDDIGGKTHRVTVKREDTSLKTPTIDKSDTTQIEAEEANEWLGTDLSAEKMISMLGRMRHDANTESEKIINVNNPTYRTDILSPTDLYEEIAIGHGYNNIEPDDGRTHTNGGQTSLTSFEDKLRAFLTGTKSQEVYSYSLCNKEESDSLTRSPNIPLKNSLSDKYNSLRSSLLPNHLQILSENTHHSYPQSLFEIGPIFQENDSETTSVKEFQQLCITICGSETGFTDTQSILARLGTRLGISTGFDPTSHPSMIDGRSAALIINSDDIGVFGEIHPRILGEFDINQPTVIGLVDVARLHHEFVSD